MNHEDMLAKLIAQATTEGSDLITVRAIVEEASEMGANRALIRLNLADEKARNDIDDLRELLGAWRSAKSNAWKAVLEWLVRGAMALLLIGITVRLGVTGMFE